MPRDLVRRNLVSRPDALQFRNVRAPTGPRLSPAEPTVRPASRRTGPAILAALIVAVAAAFGSIIGVSGSSAMQEALRLVGLAAESPFETVQRKQASAITELDRTVQALYAAVAGVSAHADFAGHREEAMTRRIDQIDDGLVVLHTSLNELRAAQKAAAADEPWRKPIAQLTAAVTKAQGDIVGLRTSLDDANPARRTDVAAISQRIDRLEQAMVQNNLIGSMRGSIQDARAPLPVSTNGHIISLPVSQ
jgi:hypothetical protein